MHQPKLTVYLDHGPEVIWPDTVPDNTRVKTMNATTTTATAAQTIRNYFGEDVVKLPLSGPDKLSTPHYGLFKGEQSVGIACKKTYVPHTLDDITALYESASAAFGVNCQVNCYWREGHYLTVAPSAEYRRAIFGSDTIWPRMVIRATYDGRAFTGSLGFYRDACKNLAMVRNAGRSYSAVIRHTSQLRSKLASLQETFTQLATQWDSVVETAQHMHATQVNLSQFLRDVYPLPQDATKRIQDSYAARVTSIVNRIVSERNRLGVRNSMNLEAATAWEAYNGVQGYVQHDMPRRKENSVFGRALAAMADSGVARALELATAG